MDLGPSKLDLGWLEIVAHGEKIPNGFWTLDFAGRLWLFLVRDGDHSDGRVQVGSRDPKWGPCPCRELGEVIMHGWVYFGTIVAVQLLFLFPNLRWRKVTVA